MGKRRRVAERRRTGPLVVGGVIAAVVGGAAIGGYALYGGGAAAEGRSQDASAARAKSVKAGPLSATEVRTAAERFLTAWQQGRTAEAASATSDPAAAGTLLTGYAKDAHLKDVTLTEGTPSGAKVPFSVKATVSYKGLTKPLAYDSALTVVRRGGGGGPGRGGAAARGHPARPGRDPRGPGAGGPPPG
ncbi:penicillin-binding protein, partial [Streptomyces anandii]